jgi:hypothetical protein
MEEIVWEIRPEMKVDIKVCIEEGGFEDVQWIYLELAVSNERRHRICLIIIAIAVESMY